MVLGPFIDQSANVTGIGLLASPVILYAWAVTILIWRGSDKPHAYSRGIVLAVLMCIVNIIIAVAGCSMLTGLSL
jgi:hypothetical protein